MKNILLAVVGLSPQVVTETLYALHQEQRKVHAIHIITTRNGKERVYSDLLGGEKGAYFRYLKEYGIAPSSIVFSHNNVHVIHDSSGNEIPDITSEEDNELLLQLCMEKAFSLTSDPDTAVFFSVAGGRKTMSSCLALAAQMYGRSQDRLYHVLVSPEFESNRDFYYPPRLSVLIEVRDTTGQPVYKETQFANVRLIPLPFISIRDRLTPEHLKEPADPASLMLSLVRGRKHTVDINLADQKIQYKGMECDLQPAHIALYAFFASLKKDCDFKDKSCKNCTDCFIEWQEIENRLSEIAGLYAKVAGIRPMEEMEKGGITSLSQENFKSYKSRIAKKIKACFGEYSSKSLVIDSSGKRPDTRYGIAMDKDLLRLKY
ncbi:MAG: TIGR02584 family CRISPR-associated protein [Desulfobacterium sp.]|nr:TIGR02584 family CRISPR-associated protein [Desulfobacterium sp.]